MSTGINSAFVRERYQRMTDAEISDLAISDATGLTPEAQQMIGEEIKRRGLNQALLMAVEVQNKENSPEVIAAICELIRACKCPACGSDEQRLNATEVGTVYSFILFTRHSKEIKVGCPDCLDQANRNAMMNTALFGWWGFPWGVLRTIQYLDLNAQAKKSNHAEEANATLFQFVVDHIGQFAYLKDNPEILQQVLTQVKP